MDHPRTRIQVATKYGAFYGLTLVSLMLLLYKLGAGQKSFLPVLMKYVLMVFFIVRGTKSHRQQDLGGGISFGQAFSLGVLIAVAGGFILGLYTAMLYNIMDPEMLGQVLDQMHEEFSRTARSEVEIETGIKIIAYIFSPLGLVLMCLIEGLILGGMFSLFTGALMKADANPFQNNQQ